MNKSGEKNQLLELVELVEKLSTIEESKYQKSKEEMKRSFENNTDENLHFFLETLFALVDEKREEVHNG